MTAYAGHGWGIRFASMAPDAADEVLLEDAGDFLSARRHRPGCGQRRPRLLRPRPARSLARLGLPREPEQSAAAGSHHGQLPGRPGGGACCLMPSTAAPPVASSSPTVTPATSRRARRRREGRRRPRPGRRSGRRSATRSPTARQLGACRASRARTPRGRTTGRRARRPRPRVDRRTDAAHRDRGAGVPQAGQQAEQGTGQVPGADRGDGEDRHADPEATTKVVFVTTEPGSPAPRESSTSPRVTTPTAAQPEGGRASSTRCEASAVTGRDIATSAWAR